MEHIQQIKLINALRRIIAKNVIVNNNLIMVLKEITADFKTVEQKFLTQNVSGTDIKTYMDLFKQAKSKNKIKNKNEMDIDYWGKKPFNEFKDFIDTVSKQKTKTETTKELKTKGAELIAENNYYFVYHITTHKAAQIYGANTKWCITEKSSQHWNHYSRLNTIYFAIAKKANDFGDWGKIAILVDLSSKVTYWDSLNKQYNKLPSNISIPKFKKETPIVVIPDLKKVWDVGVRLSYHRWAKDELLDRAKGIEKDPTIVEQLKFHESKLKFYSDRMEELLKDFSLQLWYDMCSDGLLYEELRKIEEELGESIYGKVKFGSEPKKFPKFNDGIKETMMSYFS